MTGVEGSQLVTLSRPSSFNGKQQKVIGQAHPTLLILSPVVHKWGWGGGAQLVKPDDVSSNPGLTATKTPTPRSCPLT